MEPSQSPHPIMDIQPPAAPPRAAEPTTPETETTDISSPASLQAEQRPEQPKSKADQLASQAQPIVSPKSRKQSTPRSDVPVGAIMLTILITLALAAVAVYVYFQSRQAK